MTIICSNIITISDCTDIDLQNYVVKFEDVRGELPLQYDGIPFVQLGTEVRVCHQSKRRNVKKQKINEVIFL